MSSLEKICRRETAWACEAETGGFRKDVSTDNRVIPRAYSGLGAIGQSCRVRQTIAAEALCSRHPGVLRHSRKAWIWENGKATAVLPVYDTNKEA